METNSARIKEKSYQPDKRAKAETRPVSELWFPAFNSSGDTSLTVNSEAVSTKAMNVFIHTIYTNKKFVT